MSFISQYDMRFLNEIGIRNGLFVILYVVLTMLFSLLLFRKKKNVWENAILAIIIGFLTCLLNITGWFKELALELVIVCPTLCMVNYLLYGYCYKEEKQLKVVAISVLPPVISYAIILFL